MRGIYEDQWSLGITEIAWGVLPPSVQNIPLSLQTSENRYTLFLIVGFSPIKCTGKS
jgi:hypothetical protein